jgi:hypothetical protein
MVISVWDLVFRYWDISAWDLVFRYWDKELFLPGILCLGTGIKGYFCLGFELTPMVLRPFT